MKIFCIHCMNCERYSEEQRPGKPIREYICTKLNQPMVKECVYEYRECDMWIWRKPNDY